MKKVLYMGIASAILFLLLAMPCFAAVNPEEYNMVPRDVLTWQTFVDVGNVSVAAVSNSTLITMYSSNVPQNVAGNQHVALCLKTAVPNGMLVAGNSYSISYYFPSDQDIINTGRTQYYIDRNWERVVACVIGLGTLEHDSTGDYYQLIDGCSVTITAENRSTYGGHISYINFTMPDYSGRQVYFIVGMLRGGADSQYDPTMHFGRYYGLFDFERKKEIEEFNRMWYGNAEGDYSNPFTTENYDLGPASDTSELASAFDDFEDGLDNLSAPFRITGRLLNDIFGHDSPLAVIGVIVFLVLILAVVFRLFGVT